MNHPSNFQKLSLVSLAITLVMSLSGGLIAQQSADVQTENPSWLTIADQVDCEIRKGSWAQARFVDPKSQQEYEQIDFNAGSGNKLMLAKSVTPSFVIPELRAAVRLRSQRRGVQLHARVVLPHNQLADGQTMTVVLNGPVSKQQDRFETLAFSGNRSLNKLLQEQLWLLRSRYSREVTLRDAYVDQLWLNVYTGKGKSRVQIERLSLEGVVEARRIAKKQSVADNSAVGTIGTAIEDGSAVQLASGAPGKSLVVREGTVILANEKPFFPRIVEHNGESFEYLKAIGFNTIELKANATASELAEAKRVGVWLIVPPPASVGVEPIGYEYDSVLAWSVGRELSGKHDSRIRQRIREIRETDMREGRPIFGHSVSHWSQIAQQVDIHSIGLKPIGSSYLLSQYSDWLSIRSKAIGSSKPICADVQTEMNPAVINQTEAIFGQAPPTPIGFQQLKFTATEAIVSGARCLRFRSQNRLDGDDPESRLRSRTVEYVNRWLTQIEPFVSGGVVLGKLPTNSYSGELEVTALATNRARLLLVQRPTHHEQFWAGDCPALPVTIVDSDTIHTHRVYQLTDSELTPVSTKRTPEGTEIRIDDAPFMMTLVMTQDANLISRLSNNFGGNGTQSTFDMHMSITQQWLAIAQLISGQLERLSKTTSSGSGAINDAVNAIQDAKRLAGQQSLTQAESFLNRADERLAFFRRELQATALGTFQSKTSSPLTMHSALVPLHWILAGQAPNSESSINHLAGGDFEDLGQMKRSGWANQRIDDQRLRTQVELSSSAAKAGKSGLKLTTTGGLNLVETIPLWVTSPPVKVKAKQLVRIHGWVNVPRVITGSEAGFQIVDSIAGKSLAETIPATDGWEEFTLYRNASDDTQLRIDFQLTGIGEVMVDEVTVQIIDLPGPERSARR